MATAVYNSAPLIQDPTDDKVTYIFLGSRRYPFAFDDTVTTDDKGEITSSDTQILIALDVTTSLRTSWNADVSKYPVSSGSEVSDHLSIRNNTYTLEGIISDTPVEAHNNELFGSQGTGFYRVMSSIDALKALYQAKRTFTFFSEYQKIENVVITKVDFEQAGQFAVMFTIEFEEVRFAYAKSVTLNVKKSTKKSVAANKNGGGASKVAAQSQSDYEEKIRQAKIVNEVANR